MPLKKYLKKSIIANQLFVLESDAKEILERFSKKNRKENNGIEYMSSEESKVGKRRLYTVHRDKNGWCGDIVCRIIEDSAYHKFMKEEGEAAYKDYQPEYLPGAHYVEAHNAISSDKGILGIDENGLVAAIGTISHTQAKRLELENIEFVPKDKPKENYGGDYKIPYKRFELLSSEYQAEKDFYVSQHAPLIEKIGHDETIGYSEEGLSLGVKK